MNYHLDFSHVSKTMLNLFCDSRREYFHTYVERTMQPKQPTKPMLAGTILHAMLLEDKTFDECVLPYPDECLNVNGGLIGKRAAEFRGANAGVICLKAEECDDLVAIADGVFSNEPLCSLVAGATNREKRHDAVIDGIPCRCKPDILCDLGDKVCVYDLKFAQFVDPLSFRRSCKRLRYFLQDAHYSRCIAAQYGKPVQFRFVCVEVKFPYRVQWYWLDPFSRDTAARFHQQALLDLGACMRADSLVSDDERLSVWSDGWESQVVLNPWDFEMAEEKDEVEIEA